MRIEIEQVSKRFGSFTALEDVTLSLPSGELVTLLGPSGSGKTTLLRVLAGLESPDQGTVRFDGQDATRPASASCSTWCSSQAWSGATRGSSRVDSASESRWPVPWRWSRGCCCSTNPSGRSTRRYGRT